MKKRVQKRALTGPSLPKSSADSQWELIYASEKPAPKKQRTSSHPKKNSAFASWAWENNSCPWDALISSLLPVYLFFRPQREKKRGFFFEDFIEILANNPEPKPTTTRHMTDLKHQFIRHIVPGGKLPSCLSGSPVDYLSTVLETLFPGVTYEPVGAEEMITTRSEKLLDENKIKFMPSIKSDLYFTMMKRYGDKEWVMPQYISFTCSATHYGSRRYPLSFSYFSPTHKKSYMLNSVIFWSERDSHFRSLLYINHRHRLMLGATPATPGVWIHDPYADRSGFQEPSFKRINTSLPIVEHLTSGVPQTQVWIDQKTSGNWFKPKADYVPYVWFYTMVEDEPLRDGKTGSMEGDSAFQFAKEVYHAVVLTDCFELKDDELVLKQIEQVPYSQRNARPISQREPVRQSKPRSCKKT